MANNPKMLRWLKLLVIFLVAYLLGSFKIQPHWLKGLLIFLSVVIVDLIFEIIVKRKEG